MNPIQISAALEMEDGLLVPALQGTLVEVYPPKHGTNANGEWSKQDAVLRDASGQVKLAIWNRDDMKGSKGKIVTISSVKTPKGTFGLKRKDDTYKDKTTPIVEVSKAAEISFSSGEVPNGDRSKTGAGASHPSGMNPREIAMQAANAYVMAVGAAKYVEGLCFEKHGKVITPEHFQAICASLFIHMDRSGAVSSMPTHPEKETPPEEGPDPSDWN